MPGSWSSAPTPPICGSPAARSTSSPTRRTRSSPRSYADSCILTAGWSAPTSSFPAGRSNDGRSPTLPGPVAGSTRSTPAPAERYPERRFAPRHALTPRCSSSDAACRGRPRAFHETPIEIPDNWRNRPRPGTLGRSRVGFSRPGSASSHRCWIRAVSLPISQRWRRPASRGPSGHRVPRPRPRPRPWRRRCRCRRRPSHPCRPWPCGSCPPTDRCP